MLRVASPLGGRYASKRSCTKIYLMVFLSFFATISFASERMVFFSMVSPPEQVQEGHKLYQSCSLIERGSEIKSQYYKVDGQRNGRYCSVTIEAEPFNSHFRFCALSKHEGGPNDAKGMCSFQSVNGGFSFTAENSEPSDSYASKYCYFVCLTTEQAVPNVNTKSD